MSQTRRNVNGERRIAVRTATRINIPFIPICQLSHSQRRLISVFTGELPPKQYGSIVKKRAWILHLSSLIKYHCFVSADLESPLALLLLAPCLALYASETISLLNWPPILVILCGEFVFMSALLGRVLSACPRSCCKFLGAGKCVFVAIGILKYLTFVC